MSLLEEWSPLAKAVERIAFSLLGVAGLLAGIGQLVNQEDRRPWFLMSVIGLALIVIVLLAFGIHVLIGAMDRRDRRSAVARKARPHPGPAQLGAGEVTIESAAYGIGRPRDWRNVTEEVRQQLEGGHLRMTATHHLLGIRDPKENVEKRLDVEWRLGGVLQPKAYFVENTPALLPPTDDREVWERYNYYLNGGHYVSGADPRAAT